VGRPEGPVPYLIVIEINENSNGGGIMQSCIDDADYRSAANAGYSEKIGDQWSV
jgi:hypothetical protein